MKIITKETGRYLLRFDRGEEIVSGLAAFVKSERIGAAFISAIGASEKVIACFYNERDKHYEEHLIKERLEIVSFLGTVAWKDGVPSVHAHGSFSDRNLRVIAGHITKCFIAQTGEVVVIAFGKKAGREYNADVGLNLLS